MSILAKCWSWDWSPLCYNKRRSPNGQALKCSGKCFLRLRPVFILRAETLSDPLWIKKRTILIVIGMKTSILTQFGVGSWRSEKGEALLFWAAKQEGGEMHGVRWAAQTQSRGHQTPHDWGDVVTHTVTCAVWFPVSGNLTVLRVQEAFSWWWLSGLVEHDISPLYLWDFSSLL